MRILSRLLAMAGVAAMVVAVWAATPLEEEKRPPLFDTSDFRPQIVFHQIDIVTPSEYVNISGVVFSPSPVDRVMIGERIARLRPAEPEDLIRLERVPRGARDARHRVYFEVPDTRLELIGANDLNVLAMSTNERFSHVHRLTLLRVGPTSTGRQSPAEAADPAGGNVQENS